VARVQNVFAQTAADNELFAEQGCRWTAQPGLANDQQEAVKRCQELGEQITTETHAVLVVAERLAGVTIETLMAKSGLEGGIEAILRGRSYINVRRRGQRRGAGSELP
jgi:hypothetical protein